MKFKLLLIIISFYFLINCDKKYDADEIYNKFSPSVVLILHKFYYEVSLDNHVIYFITENGTENVKFAKNEEQAIENALITTGTGFFIDDKGKIATNKHVAFPLPSQSNQEKVINFFNNLKLEIVNQKNEYENELNELEDIYYRKYDYLSLEQLKKIREFINDLKVKINELSHYVSNLNYEKQDIEINVKTVFIKIGLNDTFIENLNDLKECVKIRKSEDKDLALIQLKSKQTPSGISPININKFKKKYSLEDKIYMIGYNSGFNLAQSKDGIKSQITNGNITQITDGENILHSIPTLSGSSGSPLINERGELIGVNFAKIIEYQGFSFGVPVNYLVDLYEKKEIDNINKTKIKPEEIQKKSKDNIIEVSNNKNSESSKDIVTISKNKVNLRPNPNTNNEPYDKQLQKNERVEVLDVTTSQTTEYLIKYSVLCVTIKNEKIMLNTGKSVTILNHFSNTNEFQIRFSDGEKIVEGYVPDKSVVEKKGVWYKIKTKDGRIGWVFSEFISIK